MIEVVDFGFSVDWGAYEPHRLLHEGPADELTRRQARERFNDRMNRKDVRLTMLGRLLERNGVPLGREDDDLQRLNDWLLAHVGPESESRVQSIPALPRPAEIWESVARDVALHVGEVIVERAPHLHWTLITAGGKKFIEYQQAGLMGFKVNPSYAVVPDAATRAPCMTKVRGKVTPKQKRMFVNFVGNAVENAFK